MTKISNQYSLTNVLTADPVNGRVGINNVSPTVALDVTGAGKFSGVATAKSLSIVSTNGYSGQIIQQGDIFGTSATNLLIQSSTSNGIGFLVNGGTTFNMFINSTGNVGIGTTSPTSYSPTTFQVNGSGASASIKLTNTTTGAGAANGLDILQSTTDTYIYNRTTGIMVFGTSDTERMRITSGGVVLINTTTPNAIGGSGSLQVNGGIFSLGSSSFLGTLDRNSSNFLGFYAQTSLFLYNSGSGTNIGSFNPTSGAYTALSDINKKKDFEDSRIGLDAILGLKPTLYRMKTEDDTENKQLGFIAQEVKEFIPQAYSENGEFIGLIEMPIIAALTKAIQEQQTQINELKALLNA